MGRTSNKNITIRTPRILSLRISIHKIITTEFINIGCNIYNHFNYAFQLQLPLQLEPHGFYPHAFQYIK